LKQKIKTKRRGIRAMRKNKKKTNTRIDRREEARRRGERWLEKGR